MMNNNSVKPAPHLLLKPAPRVASFFAGIGGICLGFKQAGAEIIYANEIDKYACQTYKENFGTASCLSSYLHEGDIRDIQADTLPDFDILTGGFPCQAFSVAGYQKGFADDRGNLFFDIIRILKSKQPTAVFLENVKNLGKHDGGRTFKKIMESLEGLGYFVKYKVMNSMEYGNVPQNRERIYIVGFLCEEKSKDFDFPDKVSLTLSINDIIDRSEKKDECFYYKESSQYYNMLKEAVVNRDTIYQLRRVYVRENKSKVCPTLTANMGTGGHNVPILIDDFGIRKLTPEECLKLQGFPDEYRFSDNMGKTHKYKQIGNAVSVPVIKRIAEKILQVL